MPARVHLPADFEWPITAPQVQVYRSCETYFTDFDPASLRPLGSTVYVDPVNGSNTNKGSITSPLKTVLAGAQKSGVSVIVCRGGYYYLSDTLNHTLINRSFAIVGYPDERVVFGPHELISWKPETLENVFSCQCSEQKVEVFDAAFDCEYGVPKMLAKVSSPFTVSELAGSFCVSDGRLYVHCADSRVPDRAIMPRTFLDRAAIRWGGAAIDGAILYIENISVVSTARGVLCPQMEGRNGTLVVKNVKVAGPIGGTSAYDSFQMLGINLICKDTVVRYGAKDGYNVHPNPYGTPWALLINARSFDVGTSGLVSCNGETAHLGAKLLSINSYHERTRGPVVCSTGMGAQHCAIGATVVDCRGDGRLYGDNSFCTTSRAKLWAIGCNEHGSNYSFVVDGGGQIRYRDCDVNGSEYLVVGSIEPY